MAIDKQKLGSNIKFIRHTKGLTMEEFGKIFNPPASDSIVSRWERGISSPNSERLKVIADMGIYTMEQLLEDDSTKNISEEEKEQIIKDRERVMRIAKGARRDFLTDYIKEEDLNSRFVEVTDDLLVSTLLFSLSNRPDDDNDEHMLGLYLSHLISGIDFLRNFKKLHGKVDKNDIKELYKYIDTIIED